MTILTRSYLSDLQVRSDGRTLEGTALPYGQEADIHEHGRRYTESFTRGAFTNVDPAQVPLTAHHPRSDETLPIGVTVELEDEPTRLRGAWHVSDTEAGNTVLALAHDGVPLALSIGFVEIPGGSRWNPTRTRVQRIKAELDHIAVVRRGAYPGSRVTAVRTAQDLSTPLLNLARLRS